MKNKMYVTMTDTFMSGWGMSKGLTNRLAFVCDSAEEAQVVAENARARSDMKNVRICTTPPRQRLGQYLQFKTNNENYSRWYERGYFTK